MNNNQNTPDFTTAHTPDSCGGVRVLKERLDHTERRHLSLETKIDEKLDQLIELNSSVIKLQERIIHNGEELQHFRETITNHNKSHTESILRIHDRLDRETTDVESLIKEQEHTNTQGSQKSQEEIRALKELVNKRFGTTKSEIDKYRNIFIGVGMCGIVIFALAQYILHITMDNIQKEFALSSRNYELTIQLIKAQGHKLDETDQQVQLIHRNLTEHLAKKGH